MDPLQDFDDDLLIDPVTLMQARKALSRPTPDIEEVMAPVYEREARMRQATVDSIRDMVFWNGEERREQEVSGMLSRMKASISDRQQGIHIKGSDGEDLYLYNDELSNK